MPIYDESRLAKLDINREEIEDEEDVSARESTKGKWAELVKMVGAKERVEEIAAGCRYGLRRDATATMRKYRKIEVGTRHWFAAPPSEPDWRISRIRLSS